jgi:citrate lyase subunit beta/citryl-CoA lyase
MLFLPGNAPNMIINGDSLGADSIILDLEDAVSPDEKDAARLLVRNAIAEMGFKGVEITVRINAIDTAYWKDDLDAIVPLKPDLIMPPKSSSAEDMRTIDAYIAEVEARSSIPVGTIKLIPLIETALGVERAFEIASACPRIAAIFLGGEDLTADLRCKRTKAGNEIDYARKRLVCAARAAGIDVYDTPFTDVNDDEGIVIDAEYAKSLGFTG